MSRKFDDALNDCLERTAAGDKLEDCLSDYPQYRQQLLPLLQLARATSSLAGRARPEPRAKARNFQRFTRTAHTVQRSPRRWSWLSARWFPVARPVAISLGAILLLVTGAGVTTAASADSVPGDPLYWVKTTKESIQLRLPRSDASRAEAYAHLATVRGGEMRRLVKRGRFADAESVMKRMNHHLGRSAIYAGIDVSPRPEMPLGSPGTYWSPATSRLRVSLERDSRRMRVEMRSMLLDLPPEQQQAIQTFTRRSELGYRIFIDAMRRDRSPGSVPFIRVGPPRGVTGR
jgi:hypothetical protein